MDTNVLTRIYNKSAKQAQNCALDAIPLSLSLSLS